MYLMKNNENFAFLNSSNFPKNWFRWFCDGKLAISQHVVDRFQFQDGFWKGLNSAVMFLTHEYDLRSLKWSRKFIIFLRVALGPVWVGWPCF
jgi:hypothetical protein